MEDGDNRSNFVQQHKGHREHHLYLWHLADSVGILNSVLSMLSTSVALESGGSTAKPTSVPRRRQRQVLLEEEAEERARERERRNEFRIGFNASMHEIALGTKQDLLLGLNDRLHDYELALADAEESGKSNRVRVFRNSIGRTQKRIQDISESIIKMESWCRHS